MKPWPTSQGFFIYMLKIFALASLAATLFMDSPTPKTVHDFTVTDINGQPVALSKFKGKKLLIVNTASQCGYTPQYADLETLSKQYAEKVVVIGFPSNDFGGQEPGSATEIKSFCQKNYGVTFPIMEKVKVKGSEAHPLFTYLSQKSENGVSDGAAKWNFTKYLISEDGKLIKSFGSSVKPLDKEIVSLL